MNVDFHKFMNWIGYIKGYTKQMGYNPRKYFWEDINIEIIHPLFRGGWSNGKWTIKEWVKSWFCFYYKNGQASYFLKRHWKKKKEHECRTADTRNKRGN